MPMARLATLAVDDPDATVALAWLLIPRAKGIARRLADTSTDIDAIVAGQLWIEIRDGNPPVAYVATTIMRNVEKAVMAELGIGDAAERADRTWAATSVRDRVEDVPLREDESPELQRVLRVVLQSLLDTGDIAITEAQTLASVAGKADWLNKPMRGRAGLTSPEVLEVLTWLEPTKARTMRREVGRLLDRVAALAVDLDVLDLLERHPRRWCGVPRLGSWARAAEAFSGDGQVPRVRVGRGPIPQCDVGSGGGGLRCAGDLPRVHPCVVRRLTRPRGYVHASDSCDHDLPSASSESAGSMKRATSSAASATVGKSAQ